MGTTWVSYHLMTETLARAHVQIADVVARTFDGFVPHDTYRAVAQASRLRSKEMTRRLRERFQFDANPIAGMFHGAGDAFVARWNALNASAPLGVVTTVDDDGLRRKIRQGDDCRVRTLLAEECVALSESASEDLAEPLAVAADALRLPTVAEIASALYAQPALGVSEAARMLGCTARTLQRDLAASGLQFKALRQAVRISIAGWRLRHIIEPATQTALAAGFYDAPHFHRAWTAACAMSPRVYLALVRIQHVPRSRFVPCASRRSVTV